MKKMINKKEGKRNEAQTEQKTVNEKQSPDRINEQQQKKKGKRVKQKVVAEKEGEGPIITPFLLHQICLSLPRPITPYPMN